MYLVKPTLCVSLIGIKYEQADAMCILNWNIMTSNPHYCESHRYLVLGGNALVSPFYTRDLHVLINRCRLTGTFPTYVDMAGTSSLSSIR